VKVKADIHALMNEQRLLGKSIVMISEELQELPGIVKNLGCRQNCYQTAKCIVFYPSIEKPQSLIL